MRWIVFTDLDGTLLDYTTYSFAPAGEALDLLRGRGIPLCIVTSKTRAEIEEYRRLLDNRDPFVVENGGAIFIPDGYFPFPFHFHRRSGGYVVIELGERHERLFGELQKAIRDSWSGIRPFSTMPDEEIVRLTGVKPYQVPLMREREYDEPFLFEGKGLERLIKRLEAKGLRVLKGGRFYHLTGRSDKGVAVQQLIQLFKRLYPSVKSLGIGDSENDLAMLRVVDVAVLVKRYDGSYATTGLDGRRRLILTDGKGPEGWREAVMKVVGG